MSKSEKYYNCLSYAVAYMGWSTQEIKDVGIDEEFYKNLNLGKFLLLYAKHLGTGYGYDLDLAEESNIITFKHYKSKFILDHVAVVDPGNRLKIIEREGFGEPVKNYYIFECLHFRKGTRIDYWKVPETMNFIGFVDEENK